MTHVEQVFRSAFAYIGLEMRVTFFLLLSKSIRSIGCKLASLMHGIVVAFRCFCLFYCFKIKSFECSRSASIDMFAGLCIYDPQQQQLQSDVYLCFFFPSFR